MMYFERTLPRIRIRLVCLFFLLFGSLVLIQCGQMIAGGTSEMGNPQSARYQRSDQDSSSSHPVGIEINFLGNPVRVIRDNPDSGKDSSAAPIENSSNSER